MIDEDDITDDISEANATISDRVPPDKGVNDFGKLSQRETPLSKRYHNIHHTRCTDDTDNINDPSILNPPPSTRNADDCAPFEVFYYILSLPTSSQPKP